MRLAKYGERLRVLYLGAHSDDIEIGEFLQWEEDGVKPDVALVRPFRLRVRVRQKRASAVDSLEGVDRVCVEVHGFRDVFPTDSASIKTWFNPI